METNHLAEPWLRGTHQDVSAVLRAVLHALEMAREDLHRWCSGLTDEELNARPSGIPAVAFHMKHISRSVDRLLTYAEGRALSEQQMSDLKSEMDATAARETLFSELDLALVHAENRVRHFSMESLQQPRTVGKKALPTTVGGLLVHVADHTQRHVGQAITTAKIVIAQRS
jgi:uncharacterized damage-inducible protein DinB